VIAGIAIAVQSAANKLAASNFGARIVGTSAVRKGAWIIATGSASICGASKSRPAA
jgi:hypothetical protein